MNFTYTCLNCKAESTKPLCNKCEDRAKYCGIDPDELLEDLIVEEWNNLMQKLQRINERNRE